MKNLLFALFAFIVLFAVVYVFLCFVSPATAQMIDTLFSQMFGNHGAVTFGF